MNITKQRINDSLTIALEGRLDSTNAPQLEAEIKDALVGVTELVFDLEKLEYMSSAGLRIMISCQKIMNKQGKMAIRNVNEFVKTVFEITGMDSVVNIEG